MPPEAKTDDMPLTERLGSAAISIGLVILTPFQAMERSIHVLDSLEAERHFRQKYGREPVIRVRTLGEEMLEYFALTFEFAKNAATGKRTSYGSSVYR
ncbi:hypothetical protein ACFL1B_00570 [Nanoarchaeota archaeon]